jgi:formylglycine-generating enzyme required for sulfatase activity
VLHLLAPGRVLPAPPARPAAGDRLGEYRLLEAVGEGGMETTFKAVHLRLDRLVALKVLRPDLLHDRAAVARFEREMRAIGRLQHPNIVQALDAGESGAFLYLAMELVPGETLSQRVRRQGVLPVAEACRVGLGAARALQHAHEHGLVHRDVKPSNLMVAADGRVKLLDLGLVRLLIHAPSDPGGPGEAPEKTHISDAGGAIGTSDYMAPEQWRCSSKVDARADQYGLGCTLFYLLIGRPPFARDNSCTPFDKMQLHLNEPPPPVRALRPEVPALLERVIERLLAKDPAERFADMGEVAGHLEQLVAGEEPAALPPRPRVPRPSRRLLPVGLAVLAIAGLTVGVIGWTRDPVKTAAAPPDSPAPTPVVARPGKPPPAPAQVPMTPEEAGAAQAAWAEYLGRPVVAPGAAGLRMVVIPPGAIDLSPMTRVVLTDPFLLGETEVTRGQFRAFLLATGYRTTAERVGYGYVFDADLKPGTAPRTKGINWTNPGYPDPTDDDPIVQVSWEDAAAFCEWLSKPDTGRYRLPTEWEHLWAWRAGTPAQALFDDGELADHAWFKENSGLRPHPVRSRSPNRWGLYDMMGNVHEWAANYYQGSSLPRGTFTNPVGESNPRSYMAICGGGFDTSRGLITQNSSRRETFSRGYSYTKIGFRVLREVPVPPAPDPGR